MFKSLFAKEKPIIACVHLPALPGAPNYGGSMNTIYEQALGEAVLFAKHGVDGLIIENFGDKPFYPTGVPSETIASLAAISREIVKAVAIPVGVNVLRNDASAAMAIATVVGAHFIRVNVHMNAVVSDQGIIQGDSHHTLRLKQGLCSRVLIFADVGVKHAAALAGRGLAMETKDLCERGMVDAVIVSGDLTGAATNPEDLEIVKSSSSVPVLIGSGTTPANLQSLKRADGFIVGSYFKKDGKAIHPVEPRRIDEILSQRSTLL